ncbi:MAG: hypothetical protein Q9P90_16590, partial [candidate division KSB1 bacterium]|nr:hypothetical protein [candidate division KSB1 bacterium]
AICFLFVFRGQTGFSQTHIFLPTNSSRVRSLGLGGAVASIEDDLGAITYNPANYTLYRENKGFRITFFFSPVTPYLIAKYKSSFFNMPSAEENVNVAAALAFFKAVNITVNSFEFGVQTGEPRYLDLDAYRGNKRFLHLNSVYANHFGSLIWRFRLAQQVSVGSSLHLLYWETDTHRRRWALAASYGVTLQPHQRVRFGVSLHTFPNDIRHYRMNLEEIEDEAISLGVSYRFPWNMLLTFDVRNVGMGMEGPREQYFGGVEQELFGQIALRGGVQYRSEEKEFSYSAGIGLINSNVFHGDAGKFKNSNYVINYAVIFKKINQETLFIHAFSLLLRI